jgi:hypothetical protein
MLFPMRTAINRVDEIVVVGVKKKPVPIRDEPHDACQMALSLKGAILHGHPILTAVHR